MYFCYEDRLRSLRPAAIVRQTIRCGDKGTYFDGYKKRCGIKFRETMIL